MKKALYTKKLKADRILCSLCAHQCIISPDSSGLCKIKLNKDGKLDAVAWERVVEDEAISIDKIPVTDFLPDTLTYAITFPGNNFLGVGIIDEKSKKATPDQLVKRAIRAKCESVTFIDNEPTMSMEMLLETAKLARKEKLKVIVVTNGYLADKALRDLLKVAHKIVVQIPTTNKLAFLKKTGAKLYNTQKTIREAIKTTTPVEMVTTLEDGINTNMLDILELLTYVEEVKIPWHIMSNKHPELIEKIEELLKTRETSDVHIYD